MEKSIWKADGNQAEKKNGHSGDLNLEFEDLFDRRSNSPAPDPISDEIEDCLSSSEQHEPEEVLDPFNSKVDLNSFKLLKLIGKGAYGKVSFFSFGRMFMKLLNTMCMTWLKVYQVTKVDTDDVYAMKVLNKDFLVKSNNVEYTKTERDILTMGNENLECSNNSVKHPYIVSLQWEFIFQFSSLSSYAFQNQRNVYLVMDFINGGHILFHLREQAMFAESAVKIYAAGSKLHQRY